MGRVRATSEREWRGAGFCARGGERAVCRGSDAVASGVSARVASRPGQIANRNSTSPARCVDKIWVSQRADGGSDLQVGFDRLQSLVFAGGVLVAGAPGGEGLQDARLVRGGEVMAWEVVREEDRVGSREVGALNEAETAGSSSCLQLMQQGYAQSGLYW